jgi:hypothetical protein
MVREAQKDIDTSLKNFLMPYPELTKKFNFCQSSASLPQFCPSQPDALMELERQAIRRLKIQESQLRDKSEVTLFWENHYMRKAMVKYLSRV